MASSLDNHSTSDGFCIRSTDGEVLVMDEYYTLDDFPDEGDLQFEDGDVMVEVFGSDVYVDGVCAEGVTGDRSFFIGAVSEGSDPKLSSFRDLGASLEDLERRPQGLASCAVSVADEANVSVAEEGVAARDGGTFSVRDLVWVEVEIHQCWPGQIVDPSEDPSGKASICSETGLFLVAYFGDPSFSWHNESSLKPFVPYFSNAVMHRNTEVFQNAVNCALGELSRRVQLGLACSCLSKNSIDKLICPSVVSSAITKVLGTRDCTNDFASARSFKPKKLLEYVNLLAQSPFGEIDQLELAVTKAQVSCIYLRNGYERLPEVQCYEELMENDGGEGSSALTSPPHRLRHDCNDISDLTRKERNLADFAVESLEEASPSQKKHRIHDPSISSCIGDGKGLFSIAEDSKLTDSLAIERSQNGECALMNGFEILFSDTGDMHFPEESSCDALFEQTRIEASEVSGVPSKILQPEDANDSYWTDRIIETHSQDQQQHNGGMNIRKFDRAASMVESSSVDNDCLLVSENSPAELFLLFPETGRFPSEANLNKTLKMFGPLKESETRVDRESRRARVVFRKFGDAKAAFCSAQKYSIFGPVAVKYQLNCPIPQGR